MRTESRLASGGTAAAAPGSRLRRGDAAAVVVLAALPAVVFGVPALLGHAVLPGDDLTQNFPLRVLAGREIAAGHLPLYDPYIWSGAPLLAGWNAGAAYPLTWLFAILPGTAAWTLNMIATWAAAGLGMFCFQRQLTLSSLASFLGALSFAFAGAMSAQATHFGLVAGMSWVPLQLLGVLKLTADRPASSRLGWTAVLAAATGLVILAGEPRAVDDSAVIVAIYAAWRVARLQARRGRGPAAASVAGGLALGACLGAVQWLPGLTAVGISQRGAASMALFSSGSLPVRWLLLLVVPDLLGGSGSLGQPSFFAWYNLTEVTSYVGILPLVAAFALLGRLRLRPRPPEWAVWHVTALAGTALALGGNTPLGSLLYRLPLWGDQRLQSRNILVLDLALAVLLGYWADRAAAADAPEAARRPASRRTAETLLGMVPAAAAAAVVALAMSWGPGLLDWMGVAAGQSAGVIGRLRPWLIPYAVLAAAAAALLAGLRRLGPGPRSRLIAGFAVVDLVAFTVLCVVEVTPGLSLARSDSAGSAAAPSPSSSTSSASRGSGVSAAGRAGRAGPAAAAVRAGPAAATAAAGTTAAAASARPVAALGYPGRFAIYDPDLLDPGELSGLDPPDLNGMGPGAMPSVQGYSSTVDGRYAAATGAHDAEGDGQDTLSPQAAGDGTLDQLDTTVLLTLGSYLVTGPGRGGPAAGPPGTGRRAVTGGQRATWYLGSASAVSAVQIPDAHARRDAGAGTVIGLTAPGGAARWFRARATSPSTLGITAGRPVPSVAVTARVPGPATLGAARVTTAGGSVIVADGQLQDALLPPRWTFAGFDGPFAVFADRFAQRPLRIQALPGRPAAGAWVSGFGGAPAEPAAAAVYSPHGIRVIRSVAAIPGWSARWQPRHGPAAALPVRRDGLVQAVDVPPGRGTVTWSYTPPGFLAGLAVSLAAALVLLCCLAAGARLSFRKVARGAEVPPAACRPGRTGPPGITV
jgi:hypothetical protein